jgi:hypothetical protein
LPDESGDPHLCGGGGEWRSQVPSSGSNDSKLTGPDGRPSRSIACRWPLCSTITERRFSASNYMDSLPGASDMLLIVEVAHSSISFDRGVKLDLYARHAIPEVWLLDLMDGELLVSRKPVNGQYRTMHKPLPDETVSSLLARQVEWTLESGKSWSVPF